MVYPGKAMPSKMGNAKSWGPQGISSHRFYRLISKIVDKGSCLLL
jgi:hypothetical protein